MTPADKTPTPEQGKGPESAPASNPASKTWDNAFPPRGTQQWRLLEALLQGDKVTAISAIVDLNIMIVAARASELRRLGWPIRTLEMPHPNQKKFPNETLPFYFLDAHFRRWIMTDGRGQHPSLYPDSAGRGKFAERSPEDYSSSGEGP